jgi:hydroxypyruvate reductase
MFRNRSHDRHHAEGVALDCLAAGIEAAHPDRIVRERVGYDPGTDRLTVDGHHYDLTGDLFVVGGGNAAGAVARALEARLGDRITDGAVVTDGPRETASIRTLPGDHPVPSERGVESTRRMSDRAGGAGRTDLVLAVVGGGGSALMPAPAGEIPLEAVQSLTADLLDSGAAIDEINAVRKHCSRLKGGQLARTAAPARVVGLVFSDVVGDDLSVVASGPTAPDPSTYAHALAVLERYDIEPPDAIESHLEAGAAGDWPETPGPDSPVFDRVTNHVLATNLTAIDAAVDAAREAGYGTLVLSSRVRGAAREAAKSHVAVAEECLASGRPLDPPAVVLSGGETTVEVRSEGTGGPNQEFALASALEVPAGVTVGSVDTDGLDGSTDAAGALVDADTVTDRRAAERALRENDAYPFLADREALLVTGETGTNVNDLRVLVVES